MAKKKDFGIAWNCYYIVISLFLAFVIAVLILYLPNMKDIDLTILEFIRKPFLNYSVQLPIFISTAGAAEFWLWPRITFSAVLVSHGHYIKTCLFIGITQLMFWLLTDYAKPWISRERPCGSEYAGFSFPSIHTAFAMCFFGIIIYMTNKYVRSNGWRYFLITISVLWIALMGISRMWLNHHFFTDILGGYLIGFAFVNLFIIGAKLLED